jgi:carbonic anhydrase/acetyltransferase-like protein (isoleucine patch superfamily)
LANKPLPDLLCLGYNDRQPEFVSAPRRAGGGAAVCGRVHIGAGAQLGPSSVIRGDGHDIRIGDDFFLGERSTVHVAHEELPTTIGSGVTVGGNAVLRACTIGDRCVLEDNVVVQEGAVLGAGIALERGALVPAGARLAGGQLYRGSPAVAVRALEAGELVLLRGRVRNAPLSESAILPLAAAPAPGVQRPSFTGFVALTAQVDGRLEMAHDASIWFGARIDGGHHGISVGEGSNLQDNCSAYAMSSALAIGEGVTVGPNVSLQDCRIGSHSMIGMSSFVAAGTVIESDVVLAAGSITLPRQVLGSGWIWGGRPARALSPMTEECRRLVQSSVRVYQDYMKGFRQSFADFSDLD